MPDRPMIEIKNVTRSYGTFKALDDANLTIREGEFFSLLGPSGCGKTTLLRMIAGFDNPTSGSISVDGQPMDGIAPNRRPTNMVFQSYAIFPHLNVGENVAYGLKRLRLEAGEEKRRVEEALAQVSLSVSANAARPNFRAASASASRWPARWSCGRRFCCSTSRCRRWTRSCASRCRSSCAACSRRSASPSSWSPTTSTRRWRCPTASP